METSERHVMQWDLSIRRDFSPVFTVLGHRYDVQPSPPVRVEFSAEFDNNQAALDFEAAVRELLEKA